MSTTNTLDSGLKAFRQRAWTDAYNMLSSSDHEISLKPEHLEQLAIAAYLLGKDNESVDAWTRAHQEFLNQNHKEQGARCAFWLGMQLLNKGESARGSGWIARARRLIDETRQSCVEQGFLLLPVALKLLNEGDAANAYSTFNDATEIGKRFNNPDLLVLSRLGCGQALILKNKISEGTTLLDEAMVAVESDEVSPIAVGIVYCAVIETCQKIYDFPRAQEWTAVLSHWCDAQPDMIPFRGPCLIRRAEIMQLHGEWDDAMNETQRACELFSKSPGEPASGQAYYCKAELHRLRGEFSKAEEAYRQTSKWGKKPQPGLALLRLARGQVDTAKAAILRVEEEEHNRLTRSKVLPAFIEIMLAAGDIPKAKSAAGELAKIAENLRAPYLQAIAEYAEGAVLLADEKPRAALKKLRRAWQLLKKLNAPYETARTRLLLGLAFRQLGDRDTAEMEIEAARWIFQQLGAALDLAKIEALDRNTDLINTHGLTPRELEVLRLISTGKTNKAIASELFISERTVDRHVSNIFAKLNVPSRTAAAAYAHEHKLL